LLWAQTSSGTVRGVIQDDSGAIIPGVTITVISKTTGVSRQAISDETGIYVVPNLIPGEYEVKAELASFQTQVQETTVLTGATANVDFRLKVGTSAEIVQVTSGTAQVNLTEYKIDGVVTREQIENLPLNGRNFLQLAVLEPGVSVNPVANPGASANNFTQVSIAGAGQALTRIAVDGASVNDRVTGGSAQNFSQETVQEFQITTFNFDLATSVTGVGSINVVSRTGSNDFHGSGFFFFRDHNLAAYPGFRRDPRNPDPFFARRQSGVNAGGPLKKDRLFWFSNFEYNNQMSVFTLAHTQAAFFPFDHIGQSPFTGKLFNTRIDYAASARHTAFLRYSQDNNNNFSSTGNLESNWQVARNIASNAVLGVTSVLTPSTVNEFRYNWEILHFTLNPPTGSDCRDPIGCIGLGGPRITVNNSGFVIGNSEQVPQSRMNRTYQMIDTFTWQKGKHRWRLGGEWEHYVRLGDWARSYTGVVNLFNPDQVRTQNPALYSSLPASLRTPSGVPPTVDEILQLPINTFQIGVGDPSSPAPYNREQARRNDRYRLFVQDTWRIAQRFTLNYGLAWAFEDNLRNFDLSKPEYLRPVLGGASAILDPPEHEYQAFAPAMGFAWSLDQQNKTVVRAGSGVYYDSDLGFTRITERRLLGPSGNGLVLIPGSSVPNPFANQAGQPLTLDFPTPTSTTGQQVVNLIPGIRTLLTAQLGDGKDLSIRNIEVYKTGGELFDHDTRTPYTFHVTAGVQRELARDMVVSADFVMRRAIAFGGPHSLFEVDNNRFNRRRVVSVDPNTGIVTNVRDPIIPECTAAQRTDPKAQCSLGSLGVYRSAANFRYTGLLVRVDKRFSQRFQFASSYAFSRYVGWNGIVDYNDLSGNYGTQASDRPHRFVFSGIWNLPGYNGGRQWARGILKDWQLSTISQMVSAPPLSANIGLIDLDGDGALINLLPGTRSNTVGRSLTAADVRRLVDQYNATYPTAVSGKRTPLNQVVPTLVLPETFSSGDTFFTIDLRVTRTIRLHERARLSLLAEAFNLFNIANLTGYSGTINQLATPQSLTYGQPTVRTAQVFGTGGARAFQLGARLSW
jgi:hypothetical protein